MKFVDLSVVIKEPNPGEFSSDELRRSLSCSIEYQDHEGIGAQQMMNIFNCQKEDLPNGLGWAAEILEISTHAGTHLDAPITIIQPQVEIRRKQWKNFHWIGFSGMALSWIFSINKMEKL